MTGRETTATPRNQDRGCLVFCDLDTGFALLGRIVEALAFVLAHCSPSGLV